MQRLAEQFFDPQADGRGDAGAARRVPRPPPGFDGSTLVPLWIDSKFGSRSAVARAWRRAAFALDTSKLKPTGYVNDFAHVLDASRRAKPWKPIARIWNGSPARRWRSCWCDTLEGEPIEDVANRLFREWGIGKKGKDEGVLFLLAMKDHKSSASKSAMDWSRSCRTDASGGILRGIRPILQQGNYGGALLAAAAADGLGDRAVQGCRARRAEPLPANGRAHGTALDSLASNPGRILLRAVADRKMSGGSGRRRRDGFPDRDVLGNMMGASRRRLGRRRIRRLRWRRRWRRVRRIRRWRFGRRRSVGQLVKAANGRVTRRW